LVFHLERLRDTQIYHELKLIRYLLELEVEPIEPRGKKEAYLAKIKKWPDLQQYCEEDKEGEYSEDKEGEHW